MEIDFDPAKDASNQAKHGVSLALARYLDWDSIYEIHHVRNGEARIRGYAPFGARLYCVVYTIRDGKRRVISLRKANPREFDDYENQS